jgi:hypothetical protein
MVASVSVTLPKTLEEKIRRIAASEHRSVEETIGLLTEEALKTREFPQIFFIR